MSSIETNIAWSAIRSQAIDQFSGQTPRSEDEAPIIDVFELHPQLVLRAIDETARALADGKITWAWSVLRARLERGTEALRDTTVDTGTNRQKIITNAERWILNAGIHYDRRDHVEAELFGDDFSNGRLHEHRDDQALRKRLLDLWEEHRPRGEQAERDEIAWCESAKANRLILETKRNAQPTTDEQQPW